MSQYVETPTKTFNAGGAIAQHLRVTYTGGALAVAGADDAGIGTMENPSFASGDKVSVRLATAQGTRKMVASAAITSGVDVYAAASGKVASVGSVYIGKAMEAATNDGDVIEVMRTNRADPSPITLAAASGAITVQPSTVIITKAGVAAMTLAAPTTAQNGMILRVISSTAYAHTITATGLIDDGVTGGSKTTATFAAFAGASIELVAYGGKWNVQSKNVVTIS